LDPKWRGGCPRRIGEWVRERICLIARTTPRRMGHHRLLHLEPGQARRPPGEDRPRHLAQPPAPGPHPRSRRSLLADHDHLEKQQRPGLHHQDAAHPRPLRHPAERRAGDLRGRVRTLEPAAPQGKAWRPSGHPARLRAAYNRNDGVRHLLGALDLATGKLYYRIRNRKRWREFLSFLKSLREQWPGERLYVVCDNYSPYKHPAVRAWAAANDVEPVFLPTYGSWLNWIESEFAALRYFVLGGTDHRSHDERNAAIGSYVRWRNRHARPKVGFAASSPIRSWTGYPAEAA
jgi:transposase